MQFAGYVKKKDYTINVLRFKLENAISNSLHGFIYSSKMNCSNPIFRYCGQVVFKDYFGGFSSSLYWIDSKGGSERERKKRSKGIRWNQTQASAEDSASEFCSFSLIYHNNFHTVNWLQ